jgi:hypothetical protein
MNFSKEYIREVQNWVRSLIPPDDSHFVEYDFQTEDFVFLKDILFMLADYKNNIKQIEHLEDQLQCSFNEIELLNDEIDDMYEELCSARKENN